jgi:sigma-54 dependent transcriptional regulator, acetoin dehydrogenase operon transcriptional activator AcoR
MSAHTLDLGKKAWHLYLEKDELDAQLVRDPVASSWQRCRTLHVDPLLASGEEAEQARLLDQRREEKQRLIRVARPFMRDLSYFVSGTDFQVVLTDENGLLLEVVGEAPIADRTRQVHLCPGADWSEACRGTNAIGTAIVERAPVQIFAWEHFCAENQFLTCSAAPITDASGNITGLLDISGDFRQDSPHTLGMVVAATRAIENQLRLEDAANKLYAASRYSDALLHGITDGFVAIDPQGIVTEINLRGGELFGVNPALAKGFHMEKICQSNMPLLRVVKSGKEYENLEVVVGKTGKRIRSSGSALRNEAGAIVGAVAFFREINPRQPLRRISLPSSHGYQFEDIVGDSPAMQTAKDWAALAATCTSTVLILGESGTGKEIFANAIHNASERSREPFLAINCAAMPEGLIESELFGYSDGSFTGARKGGQAGKFEMANGGTLFLDEIGEMSPGMQAKLLRVLQERTISRIGSSVEIPVDIRIISATHCDLSKDVEAGRFREDLYYRLAVLEIKIPPLRERKGDIPQLSHALIAKISARLGFPPVGISSECLQKLAAYDWPGNVRQMENLLERALVRTRGCATLSAEHLELPAAKTPATSSKGASPLATTSSSLRDIEKQAISEALNACHGNIRQTAARLGIARNTLYRKLQDYELLPVENH